MPHVRTPLVFAVLASFALGGCGLFGSNPAEGKWKVVGATYGEHIGMGIGSFMNQSLSQSLDGQIYRFTSTQMITPKGVAEVQKYKIKGKQVSIFLKGSGGEEPILHATLSDHDKRMDLHMSAFTIELQKVS